MEKKVSNTDGKLVPHFPLAVYSTLTQKLNGVRVYFCPKFKKQYIFMDQSRHQNFEAVDPIDQKALSK